MIFFIPKSIICTSAVIGLIFHLKFANVFYKNADKDIYQRNRIKNIVKFWTYLFLKGAMIQVKEKKSSNMKKYL